MYMIVSSIILYLRWHPVQRIKHYDKYVCVYVWGVCVFECVQSERVVRYNVFFVANSHNIR